ncbi:MAG TPA: hypothetical protein VK025_04215 [Steroidobacter sp.]|nr:hypothetical protein [Steroidobacter sp.]
MNDARQRPPATPRQAATVILLREASCGVEVLVIRRHKDLAFLGGMWVFPGGALAPADSSPETLARIPQHSRMRCARLSDDRGRPLEVEQRLALMAAACRETFEETGLLLATHADGSHCEGDLLLRLQAQRSAIASQPERFAELLAQESLQLEVDRLVYWAHWITPSPAPRRFDTRFFVAAMPQRQDAIIDATEAVEHVWITPGALIEAIRERRMSVSPPTLYNLMELDATWRRHGSLQAMLAGEAQRRVPPVQPKIISEGDDQLIVLPWDAAYARAAGEGEAVDLLEYPARLRELPSRMSITS